MYGKYAIIISFFIYSNEAYTYYEFENLTEFSIGYNTESYCNAGPYSEERWNFAFWPMNNEYVFEIGNSAETANDNYHELMQWYLEKGIMDPGKEDRYDECPIGCWILTEVATDVAQQLQKEGFIKQKFDREIPIILHDLEYCHYVEEATRKANSHGEAEQFLIALKTDFGTKQIDLPLEISNNMMNLLYSWRDQNMQLLSCTVQETDDVTMTLLLGYTTSYDLENIHQEKLLTINKDDLLWLSYKKKFKPCEAINTNEIEDDVILLQACADQIKYLLTYDSLEFIFKKKLPFIVQRDKFDEVSRLYTKYADVENIAKAIVDKLK